MNPAPSLAADPTLQALSPLAFQGRRGGSPIVGRKAELAAIESELATALDGLNAVALEGEPGIGKTRLLLATAELAREQGFLPVAVTADEELRGPFLLMRSLFSYGPLAEAAAGTTAEEPLRRVLEALSGHPDPGLESMPAEQKLLRRFDLVAMAIRALAAIQPLAVLTDDVQWADDDSLRALRYTVRTTADSRIFILLAMRPEESATVTEAMTLIADLDRMGLIRRLRPERFSATDSVAFLKQKLGGEVDGSSAATLHRQSEGVPFILEELTHAYRDAAMIQQIDGTWTIAKNAEQLAPASVHTLIRRRAARLPDDTRTALGEAAVLGRSFSLKDLEAVRAGMGDDSSDARGLATTLAPAVDAGLLTELPATAPGDYSFSHEQVRQFALGSLRAPHRRAIHATVVRILSNGAPPSAGCLPLLARHAAEAGDAEMCAHYSVAAATAALAANAPEEVLRAVEVALAVASSPQDRVTLLSLRDDAMDMLRRPNDRLESLAELSALAGALGDERLEMEIVLRRAAALRQAGEYEAAADLAGRVAASAQAGGDPTTELAASLALGQALVRSELGESFVPSAIEVDLDRAEAAFKRAAELAADLGDDPALAGASRELGCIAVGRVRGWFVERAKAGETFPIYARSASGEPLSEIIETLPPAPHYHAAKAYFDQAVGLFEKLGDRRGVMSSVIAMAYMTYGAEVHAGAHAAQRIEEIRRLSARMRSLSRDSERAAADAQMAYGVHVFARAKVIPDLAIARGQEAHRAAQAWGDRAMEFLAAGGTAMAFLDVGQTDEAEAWLGKAAQAAAAAPTPQRAWRLELWRALTHAARADAAGTKRHFEQALLTATATGRNSARCEVLARQALELARLGALANDEALLALAERSAAETKELAQTFTGQQPWGAQADAALAEVALARGDMAAAAAAGRSAVAAIQQAMREDTYPELLLPTARAVLGTGDESEKQFLQAFLQALLAMTLLRTTDEAVRTQWLKGPTGREWARLAGPPAAAHQGGAGGNPTSPLSDEERRLLGLLTEGLSTDEMAVQVGATPAAVRLKLDEMFAKIGASSRGQATAFALAEGVL